MQRKERAEPSADAGWLCEQLIKLNSEPSGLLVGWPDHIGVMGKVATSEKKLCRKQVKHITMPEMFVPKIFPKLAVAPLQHYLKFSLCWPFLTKCVCFEADRSDQWLITLMCSLCVHVCVFGQHCLSSLRGTIIAGNPFHGWLICFGQGHSIPLPAPTNPSPSTSSLARPLPLHLPPLPPSHLLFFVLPSSQQDFFLPVVFHKGHPPIFPSTSSSAPHPPLQLSPFFCIASPLPSSFSSALI